MSKLTPSTTRWHCSPVTNSTARSRTCSRVSFWLMSFPRVEGIAGGFADEHQQTQHDRQYGEGTDTQPGRLQIALALGDQFAERGGAGGQAEAEEVQSGEGADGTGEYEGHEGHGRNHGIGQDMTEHDCPVAHA